MKVTRRDALKGASLLAAGATLPVAAQAQVGQKLRQSAQQLLTQLDRFPLPTDLAMAVREGAPADTEVLIKGEIKDVRPMVPRGFPQVMSKPGDYFLYPRRMGSHFNHHARYR